MTSIKCDICGQPYDMADIDIIGHNDELWFFKVRCSSCRAKCLVAVIVKQREVPEVSDLTEEEIEKFKSILVSADDMLDMRNFLVNFNGDFAGLFGNP